MTVRVGDVVTIRPAFGTGREITVTVLELGVKNGRALFDYYDPNRKSYESKRWAYESQIVSQETVEADGFRYHT